MIRSSLRKSSEQKRICGDYVQDVISAFLPIQTILKDVWVAPDLTLADAPKNPWITTNFAIAIGKDLQREVNLMNNKHASIELVDEMAKVKDDFKILPKDIIESMLEDMTAEEKDMLLRLYIFGTNIDQ